MKMLFYTFNKNSILLMLFYDFLKLYILWTQISKIELDLYNYFL